MPTSLSLIWPSFDSSPRPFPWNQILPIASTFIGIVSFLFHARNTVLHHRLDIAGVALLAPSIFDALVSYGRQGSTAFPLYAVVRFASIVAIVLIVAFDHVTQPDWTDLYIINGTYTGLSLVAIWYNWATVSQADSRWRIGLGFASIITAVALLIVGNEDHYWDCAVTQLAEPHFYGHFFAALAVTLFSKRPPTDEKGDYRRL